MHVFTTRKVVTVRLAAAVAAACIGTAVSGELSAAGGERRAAAVDNARDATKGDPQVPRQLQKQLVTIQAERRRIEKLLPEFVQSLALPGKPFGRFKFHAAQEQPWLLYASQQMLSLCVRHGVWDKLDETRKQQWLELILSAQDPKTGLFICPVAADQPVAYYRAITTKMARRLRSIGVKPRYPLPKAEVVCPRYEELPSRMAALSWKTNVYSAGSNVGFWATTRLDELESRGKPIEGDPYVMRIVGFLEQKQNPSTGFWGTSPNPVDGMNGLLKSIGPFKRLDRPVPRAELIVGSVLKAQRPDGGFGNACSPWNAMELLTFFAGQVPDRRADIQRAGLKLSRVLSKRRRTDGLYSANDAGCLPVHAGVRLCKRQMPISDQVGTSQTLSIIKMVESLFEP